MSIDVSASQNYTTVPELALAWRVSAAHVLNLIHRKLLPAHRIGARYIIDRAAAQKFIEHNATTTASVAA
jgi:excisionase family DNA binding protein